MAAVLLLVVIGAAAGLLATRLMGMDADLPTAMLIGIVGALVGGFALRLVVTVGGCAITFVLAVLGAMVLIWLWQQVKR
ncbi:GlsB/YeaQ/YmgE family stress response membrane protein [Pararhodobacter zhoushanensis]|uniref:GlsB/YeaQ/YmgE family stress response membrane protein n=1 Tax=Pararhodobacter zhoushanensis TaxID=2479545 RepID=A0ABT3H3N3_9RHOB|nr:GlsB/YeaQ/YmgE family stress response membrane protein [Pararhodobacter zhoushanensis]MCW1934290.1 GlsB/YeaQ/YmgE family stress response membrane protein [Pararhodobacter zhoushanensis]